MMSRHSPAQELDMAAIHYPHTSSIADSVRTAERLAWAVTARLAALLLLGAATVAIAGFVNYGPLADQLSSWSPLNAMGGVTVLAVLTIALLSAAKDPDTHRAEQFDVE